LECGGLTPFGVRWLDTAFDRRVHDALHEFCVVARIHAAYDANL
jgi:hypothetical protein